MLDKYLPDDNTKWTWCCGVLDDIDDIVVVWTTLGVFYMDSYSQVVRSSLSLLGKESKIKLILVTIIQILMSGLDLLGIAILGVIGALTVNGIESKKQGTKISRVLDLLGISNLSIQKQALFLGLAAAILLVTKTLTSVFLMKKTLYFLSRQSSIFAKNFDKLPGCT